jgi:hypothetical protein
MTEQKKQTKATKKVTQAKTHIAILQELLPSSQKLQINEDDRIINILNSESPQLLAQQHLSRNEWSILNTLCASYPYYAPYKDLLACLTSLSPADCHKRILEAQEASSQELHQEIKPVRQTISRLRKKLSKLNPSLKISHTPQSGYAITTAARHLASR